MPILRWDVQWEQHPRFGRIVSFSDNQSVGGRSAILLTYHAWLHGKQPNLDLEALCWWFVGRDELFSKERVECDAEMLGEIIEYLPLTYVHWAIDETRVVVERGLASHSLEEEYLSLRCSSCNGTGLSGEHACLMCAASGHGA